jgi:Protein of unknown function (DUF4199)
MAETKNSTLKSALTAGALLGIALIVFSLIIYFLGLSTNKYMGWLTYVLIIVGIIYLQIQYRDKELNGSMSYGKALGFAVLSLLFATLISAVFTYIQVKFIDPGIIDKIMSMQEEQLTKRGMSADQMETAINMTKRFMTPVMMSVFAFIGLMFWGTIISLVTSAITKKEVDPFSAGAGQHPTEA